ncbi:MAG: alkaline phosphatase D family protein [Acidobacteriota bacterium]
MTRRVHRLDIGPLVGHATPGGFRLWGRTLRSRTVGVARIRRKGTAEWLAPVTFPFVEHYDHVGLIDFGRTLGEPTGPLLEPDTVYEHQVGFVDLEHDENTLPTDASSDWSELADQVGTARTFPASGGGRTVFFFGSCRDKLPSRGENTFRSMFESSKNREDRRPDFLMMLGDQVYVDHVSPFARLRGPFPFSRYTRTYRKAFGQARFGELLRNLPTYTSMDDHEVQNNWTRGKFDADENRTHWKQQYKPDTMTHGLRAYEAYQGALCPLATTDDFQRHRFPELAGRTRYHYTFRHGDADVFVLDTRSDSDVRTKRDEEARPTVEPKLLGPDQFAALKDWLIDRQAPVKIVASPLPFFPDTQGPLGAPEDKWGGAVQQRAELLDFIWTHHQQIPRLVILSGDVHVSFIARLTREDVKDYAIYNVVSSAFHWAILGAQLFSFAWGPLDRAAKDGTQPGKRYRSQRYFNQDVTLPIKPRPIHQRNNFARLTVENNEVTVEFLRGTRWFFERPGEKVLERTVLTF